MTTADTGSDLPANRLLELGQTFAQNLTDRVGRIVDLPSSFSALAAGTDSKGRVSVAITGDDLRELSIPLVVDGRPRLRLLIKFQCCWDSGNDYLAVDKSLFHVRLTDKDRDEPLFRYEYLRDPTPAVPVAHLQVHAHRDEFVYLLLAGNKRNRRQRASEEKIPKLAEFHFPLGGHRYRPCIEDVFEALIHEFGVETKPDWRAAINEGREEWRRLQLLAAIRDAPRDAARALEQLGWMVTPPSEIPEDKTERLRAL